MGGSFFWSRVAPFLCMLALGIGQILFKSVAIAANGGRLLGSPRALSVLVAALVLYALTTIAWINALRYVPLSKGYPIMALAYVVVPILSWYFLGEKVSATYWVGVFFLIAGIAIIGQSFVDAHS
jgi:drug/metabolite transporter (DMT)-like permease